MAALTELDNLLHLRMIKINLSFTGITIRKSPNILHRLLFYRKKVTKETGLSFLSPLIEPAPLVLLLRSAHLIHSAFTAAGYAQRLMSVPCTVLILYSDFIMSTNNFTKSSKTTLL